MSNRPDNLKEMNTEALIDQVKASVKSWRIAVPVGMGIGALEYAVYSRESRTKHRINKKLMKDLSKTTPVKVTQTHPIPRASWLIPGKLTIMYSSYQNAKKELKKKNLNPIKRSILKLKVKYMDYFWGMNRIKMTPWDKFKDARYGSVIVDKRIAKSSSYPIIKAHQIGVLNEKTRGLSWLPELTMGTGVGMTILGTLKDLPKVKRIGQAIALAGTIAKAGKEFYITSATIREAKKVRKAPAEPVLVATDIIRNSIAPITDIM